MIKSSAFDSEGNLIVGGLCSWQPVFDTISFPYVTGSTNWNNSTFFLAKYDPSGNILWARVGGGVGNDYISALEVDGAGNIYTFISMPTSGVPVVINSPTKDTIIPGNYNTAASFVKWDKDGNLVYINSYPFANDAWGVAEGGPFKLLKNGTFVANLGGMNILGSPTMNIQGFTTYSNSRNLAIMDTFGNVLKLALLDTTEVLGNSISNFVFDDNENIYFSLINLSQPSLTILSQVFNPAQQYTAHLIKTDTSFVIKDIAYGYYNDCIMKLSIANNRLFTSERNLDGAIFGSDTTHTSLLSGLFTVYEIDTNLNLVWATHPSVQTIDPAHTYFYPAASSDFVYTAYQNRGTTTWDTASITTPANKADMVIMQFKASDGTCVAMYKSSGNISNTYDEIKDIKIDPQGNVYMFGNFTNSIGVPGDSVYSLGGANSPDYFILKWGNANTDTCHAHFTLYPDSTIQHNWFALNEAGGVQPLSYTWQWGDGNTSTGATPSHTYATAGNYNICLTITDSTGCTDTYCDSSTYIFKAESMVTVNAVTQLPTTTATGDILYQRLNGLVFPNPATTQAQLLFSVSANQTAQFTATDINGKIVASKTIQLHAGKNLYNFRTADWASGVYIISIKNETLNWSSRLVKE